MPQKPLLKSLIILFVPVALWLIGRYALPVFLPFLLATALALVAEPLVRVFQRRLHLPRGIAAGIGVTLTLLLGLLLLLSLGALLLRQLHNLVGILPDFTDMALSGMDSLEHFLLNIAKKTPTPLQAPLAHSIENTFSNGTQVLDKATGWLLHVASGVVTRIPDGALGFGTWLLATFMISARLPSLRVKLAAQLPQSWRQQYLPAVKQLKSNLFGWFLAQLKLTLITFLVLSAGFLLLQISFAPLWAALISLVDALPILGTGTVLLPWSLICLLQGEPIRAVGLLGIYVCAAILRSVLEPKLIGKQLGLDPLLTLLAMYTGYRLWGILGMLLAPLLAVTAVQLLKLSRKTP
jgi:sporulation integral membrane protein YtvI